jgi:protein-disulfide isomerase
VQRNRLLLLAGAVAAAVIVVVVVIAVAGGGGSSTTTTSAATGSDGSTQADSTFAGIPQHGDTLGDPKATTTLFVFEDPQCPYCQAWNLGTLPTVVNDYVRTGRLKLVYRGIEIIGPNSEPGLRAVYAAGRQNKLWDFSEALYRLQGGENSGWITDSVIRDAANAAGVNPAKVLAAAKTPAVTKELQLAARQAQVAGVPGTPTFIVQRPPGLPRMLAVTSLEPAGFEAALDGALG